MAEEVLSSGGDARTPVQVLPDGVRLDSLDDDHFAAALGLTEPVAEIVAATKEGEQKVEEKPKVPTKPARKIDEIRERMEQAKEPIKQTHGDEEASEEAVEEKTEEKVEETSPTKTKEEGATEVKEETKEETKEGTKEEVPPLLTEFQVFDTEGELEIPRDLKFSFKANKKEYKDVPLDKVVLLAQMGVYNEERQQEVEAARFFVSEAQQKQQQLEQVLTQVRDEVDALFEDEDHYLTAREEWRKLNSPEARARRAETQVRSIQEAQRLDTARQQANAYFTNQIYPIVDRILKETSVSEDEVLGRFNRLIAPLMRNGTVPFNRLPEVKQLVETELTQWAKSKVLDRQKAETVTQERIKTEKVKTALAKRQVAQTLNLGTQTKQTTTKEPRKPKKYASADDFLRDIDNVAKQALEDELDSGEAQ